MAYGTLPMNEEGRVQGRPTPQLSQGAPRGLLEMALRGIRGQSPQGRTESPYGERRYFDREEWERDARNPIDPDRFGPEGERLPYNYSEEELGPEADDPRSLMDMYRQQMKHFGRKRSGPVDSNFESNYNEGFDGGSGGGYDPPRMRDYLGTSGGGMY